jgi:hypothetical protein
MKALTSNGIAKISDALFKQLEHPQQAPPAPRPPVATPQLVTSAQAVHRALDSFANGSAPGASRLRAKHLKDALKCWSLQLNRNLLDSLTNFVNAVLKHGLPSTPWVGSQDSFASFFAGGPLIPLAERNGGVRPIAIRETFRRLVSNIATFHELDKLRPYFAQFGLGIPNGGEAILHLTNALVDSLGKDRSLALLKIDFTNAFNIVSRDIFIEQVRKLVPDLRSSWNHVIVNALSFG